MFNSVMSALTKSIFTGPGRRSLFGLYRHTGRSKYVSRQSGGEILRRRRQIERGQLRPVTRAISTGPLVSMSRWAAA